MKEYFPSVLGHEFQKQALIRYAAEGTVSHAFVFSGRDGIGKKLTALGFAKLLNCREMESGTVEKGEIDGPCGCISCSKIERGIHPDVFTVEHEGQWVIKVEQIREVERKIAFPPFEGRTKVVIIDDAHRMNKSSQNAFLKTLEEPPGSTVLILITPNTGGLLPTIKSRCQILTFSPLDETAIKAILQKQTDLSEAELGIAARLSEGSPANALEFDGELLRFRREVIERLASIDPQSADDVLGFVEFLPKGTSSEDSAKLSFFFRVASLMVQDAIRKKLESGEELFYNPDLSQLIERYSKRSTLEGLIEKTRSIERTTNAITTANANKQMALGSLVTFLAS